MTKAEIRKKYLAKRKALSQEEIETLSKMIFQTFVKYFKPSANQKIHCFFPLKSKNEVDVTVLINYFHSLNAQVFVPKVVGNEMISVEVKSGTILKNNAWGIPEPESNEDAEIKDYDFVIVPLLYADAKGNRVGYGKGFYDNFFSTINPDVIKVGVNFFEPNETVDDVWGNDIPLDYLVTPTDVLSFSAGASKLTK